MTVLRARDCCLSLTIAFALAACGQDPGEGSFRPSPAAGSGGAATGVAGRAAVPPSLGGNPAGAAGATPSLPVPPKNMDPDMICEVVHLTPNPQTPDMMIVLDRSGSMAMGGRWVPSVSAVRRVTAELESRIRFGLALFPDAALTDPSMTITSAFDCLTQPDPQMCLDAINRAQAGVCAPGNVVVPVAPANAAAIGRTLDMTLPSGGTPTSETLQRLLTSFANAPASPDAMDVHAKYVLLVTDGQPTCPAGNGQDTTPADIDASNQAIDALLAKEVRTYVIGYDTTGPGNEMLSAVLDGFAQRGGTGDTQHRPVENEASLLTELQRITGEIVGCSFTLDKPPSRADFVLVRLDGKQLNLGQPDGWKLVGDRTIELTGKACETFKNGPHVLDAEVQCSVVGPS